MKVFYRIFLFLLSTTTAFGAKDSLITYEIEGGLNYYDYREYNQRAHQIMKISGFMSGIQGKISHKYNPILSHNISGGYYTSINTKYDGQLQDGTPYATDSKDYYYFAQYMLAPHINSGFLDFGIDTGLGYRFHHQKDKVSYRRDQHYLYYILGVNASLNFKQNMTLTFIAQNQFMLKAWNKTYLTDIRYDRDILLNQKEGYGYYYALKLSYAPNNQISLFSTLYYQFWHLQDSDVKTAKDRQSQSKEFVEPRNKTHIIGLNVGVEF
ncbi:MAG: hypothetical protein MR629_00895 [Helicobacter sp.]|uniref:hypothetical protein n=1 Tax=Helicobacter sp. 10-6591 TaxID=2004998 RepID=UPI000DCB8292|nr:hypothetical protein [Helicobacter sp. 10-6591]MCI6217091.1 hypothetical protein [Helicobacter sp.]MCI7484376.1 hypothetical protein [Helicobacter sp.]MDD7567688.1 hypothetical protein [Helicobacter sp.]MDY5740614.1 hypothetical protein [Helicobacter sp.]RAX53105.1 hypothetical protein CCY97_07190 [Helicobacter sp. 10-6591]